MQFEWNFSDVRDIFSDVLVTKDPRSAWSARCESTGSGVWIPGAFIGVACSKQHKKYLAKIWAILAIQQSRVDQNELFEIQVVRKIFVLRFDQNLFLKINRQKQNEQRLLQSNELSGIPGQRFFR